MMKKSILVLVPLILVACAKTGDSAQAPVAGQIYSKVDLNSLPACSVGHPCTMTGDSCVAYDSSGGRCYSEGQSSDIVGCTSGTLLVLESYPGQAACN